MNEQERYSLISDTSINAIKTNVAVLRRAKDYMDATKHHTLLAYCDEIDAILRIGTYRCNVAPNIDEEE